MTIKVSYVEQRFLADGKHKRLEDIINLIKDGNDIMAFNAHGVEITNEMLTRIAFREFILSPKQERLVDFLSQEIDEETLYNIIRAGGFQNFMDRRSNRFYVKGE